MMSASVSPAILLSYLYFLQGLPYGLQARFLPIYFRAHGMSLSNIGFIKTLFFPWMCKTLWAPLVDRHGNKKAWLSWSMLGLGVTCIFAAGIQPNWLFSLCIVLLVFNLLTSTQDIATDGLAIEILTSSQVASGNIAQVVGYKFGAIIGGGLLAWLSDYISWSSIFIFLTLIYATAMVVVKVFVPDGRCHFAEMTVDVLEPSGPGYQTNKGSMFAEAVENPDNVSEEITDSPAKNTRSKTKYISNSSSTLHNEKVSKMSSRRDDADNAFAHKAESIDRDSENVDESDIYGAQEMHSDSVRRKEEGGLWWIKDHFAAVLSAEGTVWIMVYVLVYKLGEQGALNMMPMFLIDKGVPTADVGLWTGVVGQAVSITGSVLGGAAMTSGRYTALGFLRLLSVLKVVVLASETLAISTWSAQSGSFGFGTVPCISLMLVLLLVSGAVSTTAFTLMMQCSQRASPHCRASHYSLLATAEVLGKLVFSVFVGAITDIVGYSAAFSLFLILSVIVLPLFKFAPLSLVGDSQCTADLDGRNKNC